MIARAQKNLQKSGLNVAPSQADITALPFQNELFDIVMAGHVLEHLPQPSLALEEVVRVS
jgi:ubiquinone/menaquinone biosynthesis C-methylase UbiE